MAPLDGQEVDWGDNPYVGPRTYTTAEAHKFFGRERETRRLIALIISERTVLFYAQSGAGKSSMLNAKLVPGLAAEGFDVLPVGRVGGGSGLEISAENIFVYNLIASLQQKTGTLHGFENIHLSYFLDNLVNKNGEFIYDDQYEYPADAELKPRVLMIDQFEEILTTNTALWSQRDEFFRQLAEVLKLDDQLWLVLAMRQDFIAGLDPFLSHFSDRLRNRFYMTHLNRQAALEAIKKPAAGAGRPFSVGAAEILVNNLRQIRAPNSREGEHLAEFVEPVQLQAVCYQMWEKLKDYPGSNISARDVEEFADVDTALINFYEDTISSTVIEMGVTETDLRNWFETELITDVGTRNMVYRGEELTGELPTAVADCVKDKFIVREVVRPGGIWYELVHDRFVQPVLEANSEWRLDQPLIRMAQDWDSLDRSPTRLLAGGQLDHFLETKWQALGPLVAEYMEASQDARQKELEALAAEEEAARERELAQQRALAAEQRARAEEAEAARKKLSRWIRIALAAVIVAVLLGISWALFITFSAQRNAAVAQANAMVAQELEMEARNAAGTAQAQANRADENAAVAATNAAVAGEALLVIEAQLKSSQATSEAIRITAEAEQPDGTSSPAAGQATPDQITESLAVEQATALILVQETATSIARSVYVWPVSDTGIESCHLLVNDIATAGENARLWSQPDVVSGSVTASPQAGQRLLIVDGPNWGRIRRDIDFSGWWWQVEFGNSRGWLWENRINECEES